MGLGIAFEIGRALADQGLGGDQAGAILLQSPSHGPAQRAHIVAINRLGRPACGLEPGDLIARFSNPDLAVDGRIIIVPDHGQLGQFQAARQGDGLMADALHQTAVSGHDPGAVIDQLVAITGAKAAFRHGHADRCGNTLAEGAGRGLHPGGVAKFRVARGLRAPLTEGLELLLGDALKAGQVQQRIDQHRATARRQDEPVTVGPIRLGSIKFQKFRPEHGGGIGQAHRGAEMAGLGLAHGVHGQYANGICHILWGGGHAAVLIRDNSCAGGCMLRRQGQGNPRPQAPNGTPKGSIGPSSHLVIVPLCIMAIEWLPC